jgi:hypothetical protein
MTAEQFLESGRTNSHYCPVLLLRGVRRTSSNSLLIFDSHSPEPNKSAEEVVVEVEDNCAGKRTGAHLGRSDCVPCSNLTTWKFSDENSHSPHMLRSCPLMNLSGHARDSMFIFIDPFFKYGITKPYCYSKAIGLKELEV